MKHNEKMENLKEWNDTAGNREFTYPMWFRNKTGLCIIKFDGLNSGTAINHHNKKLIGQYRTDWLDHTYTSVWEQIENPKVLNDIIDEAIKQVINEEYEKDNSINTGGKTDYYQLKNAPFPINDFDDFAEWRGLNGNQFNMGKVMWTFNTGRHSGTDYERDLNKIIHYANRELLRLKRGEK